MSTAMLPAGSVVYRKFTTRDANIPTTLAGTPAVRIYKDGSTTGSAAGVTLTVDFDSCTGLNHVAIDTSADAAFYADGGHFELVITTGTVGGTSVVGEVVGDFDLTAAPTGQAYVLVAGTGSFGLAGTTAALGRVYALAAGAGSFGLAFAGATPYEGKALIAAPGSFGLAFAGATPYEGKALIAAPGSFGLAFAGATPYKGKALIAAPGAFGLAFAGATPYKGKALVAAPGAFGLTGTVADLGRVHELAAAPGEFHLTGTGATPYKGKALVAAPGAFDLTGIAADLGRGHALVAAPGAFHLTGLPITFRSGSHDSDRDRDIIYAAGELLNATGAYDYVSLTGPDNLETIPFEALRIANLGYSREEHVIDGDFDGCIVVHGWITITFGAIEADRELADDACELMMDVACNALNGQSLDGLTFPGFTQVTRGQWVKRMAPDRYKTATLEYRYLRPDWNSFGTLE